MTDNNSAIPTDLSRASAGSERIGLFQHLAYVFLNALVLLGMYSLLRLALLIHNRAQIGGTPVSALAEAFFNGVRFDLRLVVFASLPLLLAMISPALMHRRSWMSAWLGAIAAITLFLGIVELDFYREFNQRLNGLVFQYMREDPGTVLSMLWYGFPVLRYLVAWAAATWVAFRIFRLVDVATRRALPRVVALGDYADRWFVRVVVLAVCLMLASVMARGTLRQGPPLRWGDAFTTDSMFANQLGLNGTLSLASAGLARMSPQRDNIWKATLPPEEATALVRDMLVGEREVLVDEQRAAVRRDYSPAAETTLPVRNVVFILMESLTGQHVGALGAPGAITPEFDRLAEEGVLFTRFFSNGTHTHQGMFASFACFPNLPGFEYLMQQHESRNEFSGLPQLLRARDYDNLYVYNGDFAWDNQSGFFGMQGVSNFIGRFDYVNPAVFDPTWGVSDQDMFERAATEIEKRSGGRPLYALLQTLSNHTPYPLPDRLPVEAVSGYGEAIDQHLTAMRYSDWALGRFFAKARKSPYYKDTLFVIVGDHGFPTGDQLTELNLARFHVPLLLIGPGVRERFGARRDTVGTQVDIVPTIMGRLGGKTRHQCWGRDLLDLPGDDRGFGMIKPSGGEQIVGFVSGDKILVKSKATEPKVYAYRFGAEPAVTVIENAPEMAGLNRRLEAFIQTATRSLLDNTAGATGGGS